MWKIKAECALKSSRAPFEINILVSLNLINVVTTLYRWQGGSDMKGTLEGENELLTPKKKTLVKHNSDNSNLSNGTQLFIVSFHFIVHFVYHRDGARHYQDPLLQYILSRRTFAPR